MVQRSPVRLIRTFAERLIFQPSDLSDFRPQSDKSVLRETFWGLYPALPRNKTPLRPHFLHRGWGYIHIGGGGISRPVAGCRPAAGRLPCHGPAPRSVPSLVARCGSLGWGAPAPASNRSRAAMPGSQACSRAGAGAAEGEGCGGGGWGELFWLFHRDKGHHVFVSSQRAFLVQGVINALFQGHFPKGSEELFVFCCWKNAFSPDIANNRAYLASLLSKARRS
jgi:hypothetical protein